jgi:hypothetical protein
MKFRICIDRIVLDGFAWSASQRRAFERRFAAHLYEAITREARMSGLAPAARRAGFEALSIGTIDSSDSRLAAGELASPLAAHMLARLGHVNAGPANGRSR